MNLAKFKTDTLLKSNKDYCDYWTASALQIGYYEVHTLTEQRIA